MDERQPTYLTRTTGGLRWTYREGCEALITTDFDREMPANASQNRVRIRGRMEMDGTGYFVKRFKRAGAGRTLKSLLLGHVAKKEFTASRYLAEGGIRTPEALAVGVSPGLPAHAIIVFREITGAVPVQDLFLKAGPRQRAHYLDLIAQTTAALHRARFYHRDYHAGNLLLSTDEAAKPFLWVVDLHRSSFPRDTSGFRGPKNIADVIHSLGPAVTQDDVTRFLSRYRQENPDARWDEAKARRSIETRLRRIEARRLSSRTKRCFIDSTGFSVTRGASEVVYARRGSILPEETAQLIGRFKAGQGRLIKKDKKATIRLIETNRGELCVKAYEHLGFWGLIKAVAGFSRGHNSWKAAHALSLRGFETPGHLCLVIRRRFFIPRAVYLVSESIAPRLEAARFVTGALKNAPSDELSRFVESLGSLVGSLHRAGIYHRDLKTSNIAVGPERGTFSISLLDLDSVRFDRPVSRQRRAKNLSQIYLSVPGIIGARHRRLFFEAYAAASGKPEELPAVVRLVGGLVKGKVLRYVSDTGDAVEDGRTLFEELWGSR